LLDDLSWDEAAEMRQAVLDEARAEGRPAPEAPTP
jgi:hypothetical protein